MRPKINREAYRQYKVFKAAHEGHFATERELDLAWLKYYYLGKLARIIGFILGLGGTVLLGWWLFF